jgi:hypothetical protein
MTVAVLDKRLMGVVAPIGFGGAGAVMLADAAVAWAKAAKPGDELVYAIGHLPAWSQTPKRLRELDDLGLVFCFQDGSKTPKHYVVRRLSKAWVAPKPAPRIAREIADAGDEKARLLKVLKRAARAGRPCPYNRDLAIEADLSDGDRASYLLKLLVKDGVIVNEPSEWMPGRQITICATGRQTSVSAGVRR